MAGNGCRRMELIKLKIVMFRPLPRPMERLTTITKPGFLNIVRIP
jgi:hypothetical protein